MAKHSARRARFLEYLRTFEPARLRAAWVAIVTLAGALGLTFGDVVTNRVGTILAVAAVLIPLLQGELTRAGVFAPGHLAVAIDAQGAPVAGPASPVAAEGDPVAVADPATGRVVDAFGEASIPEGVATTYGPSPTQLGYPGDVPTDPSDEDGAPLLPTGPSLPVEEQDAAGS